MKIIKVQLQLMPSGYGEDWIEISTEMGIPYTLSVEQVKNMLIESGQMCGECEDTGEISTDEDDGEGHTMRGVGSAKCPCKFITKDHDPE